ncbi:MAG TPA: hypothetical protein VFM18_01365, partial [Methanosarcina sp.]|nr:hypothetical protein [Methanosarcina sp.]
KPYSPEYEPMLISLIEQRIDLFAAVGVDCENWEDAMDWLCINLVVSGKIPDAFCTTTSHPGETFADVKAFAEQWCQLKNLPQQITVIEC